MADAGRTNKDGLSYQSLLRMCLGNQYNDFKAFWCYYEDYQNNIFKEYNPKKHKILKEFSKEELEIIYNDHINNGLSIRKLAKKYDIYPTTIKKYIIEKQKPESCFKSDKEYIVICKKTGIRFVDYTNKSGALTTHLQETYPDLLIDTLFKRKQIENKTGKPWFYNYFDFIEIN